MTSSGEAMLASSVSASGLLTAANVAGGIGAAGTLNGLKQFQSQGGNAPEAVPQTLREVDLPGRIRATGSNPAEAGDFFGWKPSKVIKGIGDFTKDQLLAKGWTKERLLDVAEGYKHIARITPANPSAAGRAAQLRELATLID